MSEQLVEQLKKENEALSRQAFHDSLTGLYNRLAAEQRIRALLPEGGAFLVGDMDHLKVINDHYGHLEGDRSLRTVAELLSQLLRSNDILGRIGGDEFVLFLPTCRTELGIERICQRIRSRFAAYNADHPNGIELSITIGGTLCREGDTYETAFDRADQLLLALKSARKCRANLENTAPSIPSSMGFHPAMVDADRIRQELVEIGSTDGAYCQDYESFKTIYRFLERCMQRTRQRTSVILLTLGEEDVSIPSPTEQDERMERLGSVLRSTLRTGDVFTRYSSSQYLVLAVGSPEDMAVRIADRIRVAFGGPHPLIHCCYELSSSKGSIRESIIP